MKKVGSQSAEIQESTMIKICSCPDCYAHRIGIDYPRTDFEDAVRELIKFWKTADRSAQDYSRLDELIEKIKYEDNQPEEEQEVSVSGVPYKVPRSSIKSNG